MALSIRAKQLLLLIFYIIFCALIKVAKADEIKVAVASNFLQPMQTLASIYEKETGQKVAISSGSTGKLYAQIMQGAPYDLFFGANSREPKKLENTGFAVKDSRITYAVGKIILWSTNPYFTDVKDLAQALAPGSLKTLAIANPRTAPYGAAAMEVLHNLKIPLQGIRIIRGENINQTWQFVSSGNADAGFVAASQLKTLDNSTNGYGIDVPINLYSAIEQQAVLLSSSKQASQASDFLRFVQRGDIKQLIVGFGYDSVSASDAVARH